MSNFAIVTDSCADLHEGLRKEYDIDYVNMRFLFEDKDYPASLDWSAMSYTDFYNLMRRGVRIKTAQVPREEYLQKFESYLESGMDVLSVSCSSALSASYALSLKVRDELMAKYPERKIICVDSLNSCMGLGLMCIWISKLRSEGLSLEQTAAKVESEKLKMNQFAIVDDLNYLKRAGRVKAASAFFGTIFQVKPVIISDAIGQNFAVEKVKGRKPSISRIIELFTAAYDRNYPFDTIAVSHADDLATAQSVKERLKESFPDKNIMISVIGPIVGASVGPGTVSIYGFGSEVTVNKAN